MSRMLRSSGAMGAATLASRVLGLIREQVYAGFMGTSEVAGAFYVAYTIPSLFRRLLGEGALTAAFIPIFKEKEKTAGDSAMWRAANAVASGLVVAAAGLVALGMLGVTLALARFASLDPSTHLMLRLLRLMFPYLVLVCVAALFMGMLNARGHFFVPSLGAGLLNVAMIASVLWIAPRMGTTLETQVFGLGIGVLLAGVAQAGFQVPWLRSEGFRYRWLSPWRDPTVREVVRKMVPGSVGVAAFQINVLLTQVLAFSVHESIVAAFNFAVRLMEFPQGVFGVSLATYLLPTLSGLAAERNYGEFRSTLREALGYLLMLNLLASVLLCTLATPIVRLLFQWGRFDHGSTAAVALGLSYLAPGLVAFSGVNILARAFYALGDTKTPMRISVFCLGVNLVLVILFLPAFRVAGLGLANTLSASLNAGLLLYALRRKLGHLDLGELRRTALGCVIAAAAAGVVAGVASEGWISALGHAGLGTRLGGVVLPTAAGTLVYAGALLWARIPAARQLLDLFRPAAQRGR